MIQRNEKQPSPEEQVWFVTGCSSGFGRQIATQLLEMNYRTVVCSRELVDIDDLSKFENVLLLRLDVTNRVEVEEAVRSAEQHFGRIDVLVNNAGIGYFGAVEESDEEEVRKMFDVNFFGLCRMIHVVLPGMRERGNGTIVNISSIAGLRSFPSLGYYSASKFAVEGLSEALWQEVEPLGIKVMLVEPSGFRTDWAGRSANETKKPIEDYANTAGQAMKTVRDSSGEQPGDPERAALAIITAVESPDMPHRLLLGNDAFEGAISKLEDLRKDFLACEKVARDADFTDNSMQESAASKDLASRS